MVVDIENLIDDDMIYMYYGDDLHVCNSIQENSSSMFALSYLQTLSPGSSGRADIPSKNLSDSFLEIQILAASKTSI